MFTSQTRTSGFRSSRSPSRFAYTEGGCGRNGAPKQAENVGCGSVTPISVPASFAVNPERNQYIACSRDEPCDRRQDPERVGGEEDDD